MDIKKLLARTFVNGSKEQYIHDTISIIPLSISLFVVDRQVPGPQLP